MLKASISFPKTLLMVETNSINCNVFYVFQFIEYSIWYWGIMKAKRLIGKVDNFSTALKKILIMIITSYT